MKTLQKIILIAAFAISTIALTISMVDYKIHQRQIEYYKEYLQRQEVSHAFWKRQATEYKNLYEEIK